MIKLLVSFLINFPKICEYLFKVVEAYEREALNRNRERNVDLIDEWLQDTDTEQDSPFYLETQSPFVHRSSKGDHSRDTKIHE
mgnify:CR=1 FL=1|tara:strand:+ start:2806 stop:3054 length:249 start_codon:yes stop_codon:yes gene_type:complete